MTTNVLGTRGVEAFVKRGLDPENAARLNVYTGSYGQNGDVVPDPDGNILVWPIIEHGVVVGEKYRGPNKKFWQRTGSKQRFINGDVMDDPSLHDGSNPLCIVEGEPDMHTAIDVGFPCTVSVPAGAPAPAKEKQEDAPQDDSEGKFEFMFHARERLRKIKRFIIAVDNDTNGKNLAEELVRRLSASRCFFVVYPDGCKDLNDVLMKHGPQAAHDVLANAKPYPLKGVYLLSEYPDRPQIQTFSTGWVIVDTLFKPFLPSFTVVTGLPGSGKSTFIANLCVNLGHLHGWKSAIFSPEMPVVPHMRDKMRRIFIGESLGDTEPRHIARADRWLNQHMVFIDHDVADAEDQDLTLEWLIDRAYDALMRHGIRVLVLDPWNEIEHAKEPRESMTEYVNRALRRLIKFGKRHGLAVFVLAHPTKDVGKDGKSRVPTLYDIADSAAFFNKPDFGIVVDRPDPNQDRTYIHVKKVRFEGTGDRGAVVLAYNRSNSRFEMLDARADYGAMK